MTVATLKAAQSLKKPSKNDIVIYAIPKGDVPADLPVEIAEVLTSIGFEAKTGNVARVPASTATAVVGVGAANSADVRDGVGAAIRTLTSFPAASVVLTGSAADQPLAALEGAGLGSYRFASYKTSEQPKAIKTVTIVSSDLESHDIASAQAVSDAVAVVKDLVNTPAEWLSPSEFADRALELTDELPITAKVLTKKKLKKKGYGGVLGVAQGSDRAPRVVRLEYAPEGASRSVALVGKGITFDTGGLSLKPAASMVGMKFDMAGAATALAVVRAAAQLALPVKVTAWLMITDNMPSGKATRPGDVIEQLGGKTVEVLNTDAEGRLVLADGLVAASRKHPDVIIDIATLTGAIIVALGERHTGVFSNDEAETEAFLAAANIADELAWPLPLPEYMKSELDSPIADLQNVKMGNPAGGSMFAGLFLQEFVGSTVDGNPIPWIHLDIAGSAEAKSPRGPHDKGATGATVRTILTYLAGSDDSSGAE